MCAGLGGGWTANETKGTERAPTLFSASKATTLSHLCFSSAWAASLSSMSAVSEAYNNPAEAALNFLKV